MWNDNFIYTALLVGSIFFPFVFSFEKNICFIQFLKPVLLAILLPGIFFIAWDVLFTKLGFWSFNTDFTFDVRLFGLPIEEWMFFVVIPFCSLFIYEVLRFYLPKLDINKPVKLILWIVSIALLATGIVEFGTWYTFICLTTTALFLMVVLFQKNLHTHLSHFALAFLVTCIPMLVVNGVLTAMPVVEYNAQYFSNFRIGTIPAEDFSYFLLLFSMNFFVYEKVKQYYRK